MNKLLYKIELYLVKVIPMIYALLIKIVDDIDAGT